MMRHRMPRPRSRSPQRRPTTLRGNALQYRVLFERNPHPMWVFDPESLRFLAVNDAAVAQYGYSRREFFRLTVADIRPAAERANLEDLIVAARRKSDVHKMARHQRKSGEVFEAEVHWNTVRFRGRRAHGV